MTDYRIFEGTDPYTGERTLVMPELYVEWEATHPSTYKAGVTETDSAEFLEERMQEPAQREIRQQKLRVFYQEAKAQGLIGTGVFQRPVDKARLLKLVLPNNQIIGLRGKRIKLDDLDLEGNVVDIARASHVFDSYCETAEKYFGK